MTDPVDLRQPVRRLSLGRRRTFELFQLMTRALGGRRFYRWRHLSPGGFRVRHERVALPPEMSEWAGFRIVQFSDLHAGPFLGAGDLAHVVDASNALEPDLVAITGDLLSEVPEEAFELIGDLSRLRARDGVWGVFGNHDYRQRREGEIAARYAAEAGVRFLRDEHVLLERGGQALALVGLEDLEEARVSDYGRAVEGLDPATRRIVLCHHPAAGAALAGPDVLAVLSGHTHGHQIDLPLVRRLAPPHPGDRRDLGSTVALTSRGLGALGVPLRLRSPAELVLLELCQDPEVH